MPIVYKQGDLLQSDCDVIVHGCNCFNQMGSGIAKAIRAKYPEVYEVDFFTKRGDPYKLGTFSKVTVHDGSRVVYNAYTQYKCGTDRRHLDYAALEDVLMAIREDLINLGAYATCKFGMPKIGAGLAGGDWNLIEQIIEKVFVDKEVEVHVL